MKAFDVVEARWLGVDEAASQQEQRWFLRGRAYVDLRVGDALWFVGTPVVIDAIVSYGKGTYLLSKGMPGELTVRPTKEDTLKEDLERITHNRRGEIIDVYIDRDQIWPRLCSAVLCLDIDLTRGQVISMEVKRGS